MIHIVDPLKEKESVLRLNVQRIKAAKKRGEKIIVYHPVGAIHGRLANIPGVEYVASKGLGAKAPQKSANTADMLLLEQLTTLNAYRMPVSTSPKGELFIHWFYRDRAEDRLSRCEIFHLNMLRYFNVIDRVERIHIRCAFSGKKTGAMREAVGILSEGKAKVDFQVVAPKESWEHDTFKECVEYAVATGKFVYYAHFKGVTRWTDSLFEPMRGKGTSGAEADLNLAYWSYLMYLALFTAPDNVKAIGPLRHLGVNKTYKDRDISWSRLCKEDPVFYYCGSFQGFDGGYLRECMKACGMPKRAQRDRKLWIADPYCVEMFLSMVSLKKDVYSLPVPHDATNGIYTAFSRHRIPQYEGAFKKLYAGICVANWSYKNIGGTETFNYAMATALKQLGYPVYYYAPEMGDGGITENELARVGIAPYRGEHLLCCFANQNTGRVFVGKCPVIQTCHSAITRAEQPTPRMSAYVAVTEEVADHLAKLGHNPNLIRNGIDLERFRPNKPLRAVPKVLSICQGDDTLLRDACARMGLTFQSVPKSSSSRVWHIEDLINDADIVVGIGRSLYDAMACGRACISWDNRMWNPFTGCGYVTADNWYTCAKTNFIGKGFPRIDTADALIAELSRYNPEDGAAMRRMAEKELDVRKSIIRYLELAGLRR